MPGYSAYVDETEFEHGEIPAIGILVANLGTPEAPTAAALKPYLAEFLSDPRVIELPRWQWEPILRLFVLTRRPKRSAGLYAQVWREEGSPLLYFTERIARGIEERVGAAVGERIEVEVAMRYGRPPVSERLDALRRKGCRRILVLPLYPQYSATTTASTFDAVFSELGRWRWIPELRTIASYHDEPGYVAALAASLREAWSERRPEKLLFSFHGIPRRYFENGDPYHCLCHVTARRVAEELDLPDDAWEVSFQSLFGKEEWLKPYTEPTVRAMASAGVGSLDVVCPGFAADCLETLEEIDGLNRHAWEEEGGAAEGFRYVPCLNDRPDHVEFLSGLVLSHLQGWTTPAAAWDEAEVEREAEASRRRAEAMAAAGPKREDAGYGAGRSSA